MESLLSIEGVARIIGVVGLPIVLGSVLLVAMVLSGGAAQLAMFIEDLAHRFGARPPEDPIV